MATTTTHLGLTKPDIGDTNWGITLNSNFDLIDDVVAKVITTSQSGTSYTIALTDAGTVVEFSNASPVTVTVPPNASIPFAVGASLEICQMGAGQVTVAAGAGVTILSPGSRLKLAAQYSAAVLRKRATNEWVLAGDIVS